MSVTLYGTGKATGLLLPALGQCRVSLVGSALVLKPYKGNLITINGKYEVIPAAGTPGFSFSGTAAPLTAFDIYAYMDAGGVMQLERAANGSHSVDATTGVEIKTGDPTRTLVAKAGTGSAGNAWVNNGDARLLINWFNRRRVVSAGAYSAARNWPNNTWAELDGAARCYWLCWGDEAVQGTVNGTMTGSVIGHTIQTGLAFDSSTVPFVGTSENANQAGGAMQANLPVPEINAAEGLHYTTPLSIITGGVGTWNLQNRLVVQG